MKATNGKIKQMNRIQNGCWIDVFNPSKEEIEFLKEKFDVPSDFITDPLDDDEKPRIEKEDGATLIIMRIPYRYPKEEVEVETIPLGIILKDKKIITICLGKTEILDDFYKNKVKEFYTNKRTRFIIQIFKKSVLYFGKYLDEIEKNVESIEKTLTKRMRNKDLMKLLDTQKTLTYFNTAIITNESIFERIVNRKILPLYEEDQELIEDMIIDNRQLMETTQIFIDILNNLMNIYGSVISNNLNTVMKFLTSMTIILSLPTMVSSFYGMNVSLPFQNHPHAFLITVLISFVISSFFAVFAIKKDWL
jgi:magnesium transporter